MMGAAAGLSGILAGSWFFTYLALALGSPRFQNMVDPATLAGDTSTAAAAPVRGGGRRRRSWGRSRGEADGSIKKGKQGHGVRSGRGSRSSTPALEMHSDAVDEGLTVPGARVAGLESTTAVRTTTRSAKIAIGDSRKSGVFAGRKTAPVLRVASGKTV